MLRKLIPSLGLAILLVTSACAGDTIAASADGPTDLITDPSHCSTAQESDCSASKSECSAEEKSACDETKKECPASSSDA